MVLALDLDDWTQKAFRGWPEDRPADVATDVWAGVVPLEVRPGEPIDAPDLGAGIPVPASCRGLVSGRE